MIADIDVQKHWLAKGLLRALPHVVLCMLHDSVNTSGNAELVCHAWILLLPRHCDYCCCSCIAEIVLLLCWISAAAVADVLVHMYWYCWRCTVEAERSLAAGSTQALSNLCTVNAAWLDKGLL